MRWIRAQGELWQGAQVWRLSPRLAAVADPLLRHSGEVVPRRELAAALGYRPADGTRTRSRALDTAIWRLRRRLPGDIAAARGFGYRWDPPRPEL